MNVNPDPVAHAAPVVVVGAGQSGLATITLATRHPLRFIPQRIGGHDVH